MLSQSIAISSRTQIWVALVVLTLFAIALSVGIAALVLKFTTTGDPNALHLESDVYAHVIIFSAVTPAVVCPLVVYTLLTTLRDLNLTRAELDLIARKDSLTGLLNRRGFDDAAQRLIVQARSSRKPVSALMCDIDMFKQVNDTQGHEGGDAAIRHVADIVAKALESVPDSVAGRQGGDEFAILVVGRSIRELAQFADDIRMAIESAPMTWRDEALFLTISLGVAISASEDADVTSLLSRADQALYEAKKRGRNRVQVTAAADAA
jgi:diguanylate cyclase (GGDEF)-like protein